MLSLLLIFRIRQGVWRALCLLFCLTALPAGVYAASADDERDSLMRHLKDMDLGALMEVETSLDDTFDLFEGLIAARRVTVATGEDQDMAKAPSVTTVITARDMEAMGAETIDEVLETVPGLHVGRDGGYDSVLYTFRGIHSPPNNQQTLVLINGIPLTSALTRSMNFVWSDMLVNAISRIEVIRGPGSAVYGADAFAGVINIITKTKEDIDGTEAGLRGGSFGTGGGWILHGGTYGSVDVAGTLQFQTTDGHEEIVEVDAQTGMDQTFGTNASYAPGPVNMERKNIDARLDLSKGNWQLRAGWKAVIDSGAGTGLAALDPLGSLDSERMNADLTWHDPYFTEDWDVSAQFSYLDTDVKTGFVRIFPANAFGGVLPDGFKVQQRNSDRNIRVGLSGFYAGFKKHLIRVGSGYHLGDLYKTTASLNSPTDPVVMDIDTGMDGVDSEDWYAYLQDIWNIAPDWELTAGLRYDNYPDVRETFNPRLALVWQTRPDLTSKFLYGRAFRAPGFMELFDPESLGGSIGNPSLEPETLEVLELAFDWRARENLNLAINVFTHKWRDRLIVTPLSGKDYGQWNNAGEQKGRGVELEARWKMTAKSSLLFNYAFQDSEDGEGNDPGGAPRHQAHLRTDWLFAPSWFLDAKLNWVADRKRAFGDKRPKIDDYTTVDMTVRRKEKGVSWNFAVGVRNLFDADVREPTFGAASASYPFDYPLAGRSYWAEIRYRF
ncbi:MAG: TonB-dependent receptor [Gammaproteobacteria bacterium]|nr:TonB-dependent receptor [Gammaproteobacteria bacterium]